MHARGTKLHKVCREKRWGVAAVSFLNSRPGVGTFLTDSRDGESLGRPHSAPYGTRPQPLRWAAGGSNQPSPGGDAGSFFFTCGVPALHGRLWGRAQPSPSPGHALPPPGQAGGPIPGGPAPGPAQTPCCRGGASSSPPRLPLAPVQPVGAEAGAPQSSSCSLPTEAEAPPGLETLIHPLSYLHSACPRLPGKMKPKLMYQELKLPTEESVSELPMNEIEAWKAAEKKARWVLLVLILAVVGFGALMTQLFLWEYSDLHLFGANQPPAPCYDPCEAVLVESIPEGLDFPEASTSHPSTSQAWLGLLARAHSSLDIASFYWTLTNNDTHTQEPSAQQGEEVLRQLQTLAPRGVKVRIAVSKPSGPQPQADLQALLQSGAQVRMVDMQKLTHGVLHTKFWVVDQTHFYIGSANMDWRSLTQVKELGVVMYNCSCLAQDLTKIFEAYWYLGKEGSSIPSTWPQSYDTLYNQKTPMEICLNGTPALAYLASAPPPLCPSGRTPDLKALLNVVDNARSFIYIAVMNYLPTMEFSHPRRFWPAIDDGLRRAAYERGIKVRLLVSCWGHSEPSMRAFLLSLAALRDNHTHSDIQVKLFVVPADKAQARIPYARVNHNKYMVTERAAYIGTSNWSGSYFTETAGTSLLVTQNGEGGLRSQLEAVFLRDWDSPYSHDLDTSADSMGNACRLL